MIKYKSFFLIDDGKNNGLFNLKVGGDKDKLINDENSTRKVRVVSNTTSNNGVESYIYNNKVGIKNCITIATRGNDYFSCYQDDYTVTIVRTLLLYTDKFELNKYIGFYICSLLRMNKYKCTYGRVLSGDRIKLEKISLPVDENEEIQWQILENKGKEVYYSIYQTINKCSVITNKIELNKEKWKEFSYKELFTIKRGKRLIESERVAGNIQYYSASEFNNGLTDLIANSLFIEKNSIIYTTFGDAYYVGNEFTASDEINIFQNEKLNVFNSLFICTLMDKNKYKYSFGRKSFQKQLTNDKIKLPITQQGKPDWEFMEDYIKSLPYSKNLS